MSSPGVSRKRRVKNKSSDDFGFEVIGVDVGTSTIKCSAINSHGEILYEASGPSAPLQQPAEGFVEVDPEDIFSRFCDVVRRVVSRTRQRSVLLSLSTMTPVFILTDREGKPVRPAILYNDSRTTTILKELNKGVVGRRLFDVNGNVANVQQWGPKWLWLKKYEPENYRRTNRIFDLASFIIYKLTGEHVIDLTAAQEGGFLDYRTRKWSGDLLSAFDVDDSALPSLKATTDIVGELKPDAKEKLGAPRGMSIKVNAGCVDAIASLISMGHVAENELSFVVGSTGIIALSTTRPRPDRRLYLDLSPVEGQYFVNGGTAASGLFFDYVLDLLGVGEPRYARAEELAMRCQAGSRGVVMLPYIYGERTPIFDPLAKSVFFGLTPQVKQGEIIRGSMEAIAFSFLHHIIILKEKGYQYTKIRVTGGATRSGILLQTLADVMQTELTCYRDVSPTVGNAMLGFLGLGIIKDWTQVDRWVGKGETVLPDRTKAAEYSWKFKVYLDLYQKLREHFHARSP